MESHALNPGWRTEFRILDYVHEQGFSNINQNPFDNLRTRLKVAVTAVTFFQVFMRPFLLWDLPVTYRKGQLNSALSLLENDNVRHHKEFGMICQANQMQKERSASLFRWETIKNDK